ncbi:MAG TPA: diguanylate cyclase [Solirubrobacteraceae bacterium]|nr:diguanylate cyclase [Solirubrobacteraceae bacterium]
MSRGAAEPRSGPGRGVGDDQGAGAGQPAPRPAGLALVDPQRLEAIERAGLLETERDEALDRLARLAARLLGVPVSLVSIVDSEAQRFVGEAGLGLRRTPLTHSFCRHVVVDAGPLVVADAREDSRLRDNPAIAELSVIAYAGMPLTTAQGHTLGSFCAIDSRPREWSREDLGLLEELARSAVAEIELRAANRELAAQAAELREAEAAARRAQAYSEAILSSMHEGVLVTREGSIIDVNGAFCELTGFAREDLVGARVPYPFWAPEAVDEIEAYRLVIADGRAHHLRTTYRRRDGSAVRVSMHTVQVKDRDGTPLAYVTTAVDITEQERHEAQLEHLANHDALTGLLNRRVFQERLRAEIARARRHGRTLSVAIMDLDHFKQVNDRFGHDVGDRVLQEVSRRLEALTRRGERIARIGGEEFGWILPDCDLAGARAAAERARRAVGAQPFPGAGPLTMSAGVCELCDEYGDLDALYRGADQALYAAKRGGRDRTESTAPPAAHG